MSRPGKARFLCLLLCSVSVAAFAQDVTVRLKDIADFEGVRENQLVGFGIVTGLDGMGDSENSSLLQTVMSNLLSSFGVKIPSADIKSRNCAVVMVTSDAPTFARGGERIDVYVSSIGDAQSVGGGILLQTNLKAANGDVYAVAQGRIGESPDQTTSKTVGYIPNGAIVEKAIISQFVQGNSVSILLRNPDFTTASRVADAVSKEFPDATVTPMDASLITVRSSQTTTKDGLVAFIAKLEDTQVVPDTDARVVINAQSGVIVFGKDVKIGQAAVSYRGTNLSIADTLRNFGSPPKDSFTTGGIASVGALVTLLQKVGLKTDTIIEILKALDRAGALYGRLIIM